MVEGRGDGVINASNVQGHHAVGAFGGQRRLEDPLVQYRDDQGDADPQLMAALARGDAIMIIEALANTRVLVALAKSTAVNPSDKNASEEKTSDMSIACLRAADGRIGLLVFSSVTSLSDWNNQARPVPINGREAAIAALDESASALIVDPAGPMPFTVTLPDLVTLTGTDQRWRALALIEALLGQEGENKPVIKLPESGPVVVAGKLNDLKIWSDLLSARGDIHAFVPEGIALEVIAPEVMSDDGAGE